MHSARGPAVATTAIVPWIRRPRFVFEDWGDEADEENADYRCVFDPYAALGLPLDLRPIHVALTCPRAKADIHNAYLELSRRLHPDCRHHTAPG